MNQTQQPLKWEACGRLRNSVCRPSCRHTEAVCARSWRAGRGDGAVTGAGTLATGMGFLSDFPSPCSVSTAVQSL